MKYWVLGVVAVSLFLGGGVLPWTQGVFLILLGGLVLVSPPELRPPGAFLAFAGALLLLAVAAFLPATWFFIPGWRSQLTALGLDLADTVSPQPWRSLEALILLFAGCLWFCWLTGKYLPKGERLSLLRMVAAGTVLFAVVTLWFFLRKTTPALWAGPRGFGPFPNRNQTGDVLAVGGILLLAFAQRSWHYRRHAWPAWLLGFGVVLYATIENGSRAGVVLLLGGSAAWALVIAWRSGTRRWLVVGGSVTGILLSLFLLFGGATLERIQSGFLFQDGYLFGFRGQIQRDVAGMMNAGPLAGIGLGNFRAIFPFFREFSRHDVTVLHPESDWFWAGAELGWPGLVILLVAAGFWVWRCLPFSADAESRCRAAAFFAFGAFLVHGLADVSGHRLGSAVPALFIGSLALRHENLPILGRLGRISFRLGGGLLLLLGVAWTADARGIAPWSRPAQLSQAPLASLRTETARAAWREDLIRTKTIALRRAPLDSQLYLDRATARAVQGDWVGALGDFRICRALEPIFVHPALSEGAVWCQVQPMLALPAWQHALDHSSPAQRPLTYARILADGRNLPVLRKRLRQFAGDDVPMQLTFLRFADPAESIEIVEAIRARDPRLEKLNDAGRGALFAAWIKYGDAEAWDRLVDENPAWLAAGWSFRARAAADRLDFRRACEITFAELPTPLFPKPLSRTPTVAVLQQRLLFNPGDYAAAYALYQEQTAAGQLDDGVETLRRINSQTSRPLYFSYLEARLRAAREEWDLAWHLLQPNLPQF